MGVLDGLTVLDLSWGVSGPATAMLLADNGADVTRIERPGVDPFAGWLDGKVYNRGKRSAVLDLTDADDVARFRKLAATADVVIESFAPGVTKKLGIDFDALAASNPRLVYCSITGYGAESRFADRPGIDQLVAARIGYQWETRAWPGSAADHVAGVDLLGDSTEFSEQDKHWLKRHGPVMTATPSPSIAAAYLATLGISGALRAREHTGRGQHVETSLLQGIFHYQCCAWQRYEDDSNDGMLGSIMESSPGVGLMSGPWSFYECADGTWVCNWGGGGSAWARIAGAGDELEGPTREEMQASGSISAGRASPEDTLRARLEVIPIFKKFPAAEWVRVAAEAGIAMQPVRAPEQSHADPALVAQGSIVEVDDPELGRLRQSGLVYRMHKTPGHVRGGAARRGEHTDAVKAEADAAAEPSRSSPAAGVGVSSKGTGACGQGRAGLDARALKQAGHLEPLRELVGQVRGYGLGHPAPPGAVDDPRPRPHAAVMTGNVSFLRKAPPLAQDAAKGHVGDHQSSQPPEPALRPSVFANFSTIRLPRQPDGSTPPKIESWPLLMLKSSAWSSTSSV